MRNTFAPLHLLALTTLACGGGASSTTGFAGEDDDAQPESSESSPSDTGSDDDGPSTTVGSTMPGSSSAASESDEGSSSDTGPSADAVVQLNLTSSGSARAGLAPGLTTAPVAGHAGGSLADAPQDDVLPSVPSTCMGPTTPIGQASATELESLRYYISSIMLCESLDTVGTSWGNPSGCLTLYQATEMQDYASFGADEARAHPELYVDLLDPSTLAGLNQPIAIGPEAVRQYNYGVINWYRPVMVRASVTLDTGGGDPITVFTSDGTVVEDPMFPGAFTNEIVDLTAGPASDGVAMLSNGGNWFKFQHPFEITQDDLDAGTDYTLDLVFDPDRIISGMNCTTRGTAFKDEAGRAIFVPLLELSPVPRASDDSTWRETYLIHVDDPQLSSAFDLRLELYSRTDDPERTIYGADLKGLIAAGTTNEPLAQKVSFVVDDAEGLVELQDYAGAAMVSGLARLDTVGDAGTLTIPCNGSLPALYEQGCAGGSLTVGYELTASASL
ncbi:MAG: hypothetical protein IAG13_24785 [Deltaproteobacteria bacterium]|nr:hypothetical protein [Nannocystaceae bacterium]